MVVVSVCFRLASKRWQREFIADDGSSVQQLKGLILKSTGSAEDLCAFELRRLGVRMPDSQLIWEDCVADFKFLGADRGSRRAARDAANAAAAKAVGTNPTALSLENVLLLQADLKEGFGRPAFQKKLDELEEKYRGGNERMFQAERQKLFLTVQKLVLPKWGFAGNAKGVFEMMGALMQERFNANFEFQKNGWLLNKLLRLGPVGPMPEAPPAAPVREDSSAKTEAQLRLISDLIARFESVDFRDAIEVLARRLGNQSAAFSKAKGLVDYIVYEEVFPKHGRGASEMDISAFWADVVEADERVHSSRSRLVEAFWYAPSANSQDEDSGRARGPCVGSWSSLHPPQKVYTFVQLGNVVVVACPEEQWSPARGTLNDKQIIVLEWPDGIKGYTGQLKGDVIVWQWGDTWHRHVETLVTVLWEPGDGGRQTSLQAPPGATVAWVREELFKLDGSLRTRELKLAMADSQSEPLPDAAPIVPNPCILRVLLSDEPKAEVETHDVNGKQNGTPLMQAQAAGGKLTKEQLDSKDKPAEAQPATMPRHADEPGEVQCGTHQEQVQAADGNCTDEQPATPRTDGQLFDFHDLPDDV